MVSGRKYRSNQRNSDSISTTSSVFAIFSDWSIGPQILTTSSGSTWSARPTSIARSIYFRRTRARSSRIGIALQACLYRTEADLESLLPLGAAIRLVKGVYLEPRVIAFPRKADVDENFYKLACRAMVESVSRDGALVHIATHDRRLLDRVSAFIDEHRVPTHTYEYAMLYGIQRPLQLELARSARPLRVLISYGDDWFPWYMRRLAERPANVWFVLKNVARPGSTRCASDDSMSPSWTERV